MHPPSPGAPEDAELAGVQGSWRQTWKQGRCRACGLRLQGASSLQADFKALGHKAFFPPLLPCVFPAAPSPVFCSPESSLSVSPGVSHQLFQALLEVSAGALATWEIKSPALVNAGLEPWVCALGCCTFLVQLKFREMEPRVF